jgi:hypothetical protein
VIEEAGARLCGFKLALFSQADVILGITKAKKTVSIRVGTAATGYHLGLIENSVMPNIA